MKSIIFQMSRSFIKEKRNRQLWGIQFNHCLKPDQPNVFAVTGGTQFSIYECTPKGQLELQMCFEDPDVSNFILSFFIILVFT